MYTFGRGDGTDTIYDDYRYSWTRLEWFSDWEGGSWQDWVTTIEQGDGGSDTLEFQSGITASDLMIGVSGNDLVVGVRNPATPGLLFSQLTDRILLRDWRISMNRIETFRFVDGSVLGLSGIMGRIGTDQADNVSWTETAVNISLGAGNDTIVTGGHADTLSGGDGNDTLRGGGGSDVLQGDAGADSLSGEDGADRLNGGDGGDSLRGGAGDDTVLGDAGADRLFGEDGADSLNGGDGGDTQEGGAGSDTLDGGAGDDNLIGGAGSDTYLFGIGSGADRLDAYRTDTALDKVRFGAGINASDVIFEKIGDNLQLRLAQSSDSLTVVNWFLGGNYQLGAFELSDGTSVPVQLSVPGTVGADVLNGTAGVERLIGLDGADSLYGYGGMDTLFGGIGNDRLEGGQDGDVYTFGRGDGTDTIYDDYRYSWTRLEWFSDWEGGSWQDWVTT
ncbi:MAG: calcium-binding protein, partial [bacterium]